MNMISALWRQGAGTPEDPNNGRLIWRLLGIYPVRWQRWRCRHYYARDLRPLPIYWLRTFWNELTRYGFETCNRCGRRIGRELGGTSWHADDDLYIEVIGHDGGTFCAGCFTRAAERRGLILWWKPQRPHWREGQGKHCTRFLWFGDR